MSVPEGILESEELSDPKPSRGAGDVVGRSPMQLAMARFRADKKSMAALVIVVLYALLAISAPILVKLGVVDPYAINLDTLNDISLPKGDWWGVSWDHPLGVEPGLGRDVLDRLWYG